jgi:hypothetical protein
MAYYVNYNYGGRIRKINVANAKTPVLEKILICFL